MERTAELIRLTRLSVLVPPVLMSALSGACSAGLQSKSVSVTQDIALQGDKHACAFSMLLPWARRPAAGPLTSAAVLNGCLGEVMMSWWLHGQYEYPLTYALRYALTWHRWTETFTDRFPKHWSVMTSPAMLFSIEHARNLPRCALALQAKVGC